MDMKNKNYFTLNNKEDFRCKSDSVWRLKTWWKINDVMNCIKEAKQGIVSPLALTPASNLPSLLNARCFGR